MSTTYAAKNAQALDAYITAQQAAHALLAQLTAQIEAHQDAQPPAAIHWGHVGDMQEIVAALRTLTTRET